MPHWHYDCELIFVEKGTLNIFCNQSSFNAVAGDAFFVDSEQIHNLHAVNPGSVVIHFIFSYDIIKPFAEDINLVSPRLSHDYGIPALYEELKKELKNCGTLYDVFTENLISRLMIDIFRNEPYAAKDKGVAASERLKPLLSKIDEEFEFYTLDTAAEFMNMNTAYFSRLFHKLMGMTFTQYLNYIKVLNAVSLLQSDEDVTVTEVSERCGFDTIRSFNRIFKIYTGYSPKNLPKNYTMEKSSLSESANPTLIESVLLESSDE